MTTSKFKVLFNWLPKSDIKAGEGSNSGKVPFYTSSKSQKLRIDQIQFSKPGLILGTGGNASIHYADGEYSVSTDCIVAIPKDEKVNIKYVYYFLKGNIQLLERGFRGSGMRHIAKGYIENLDISYPSIEDQNRIVTVLDKIQSLINQREKSVSHLDDLIQSIYLNMFGVTNPEFSEWPWVTIDSFKKQSAGSMRTGPFGSNLTHDMFEDHGDVAVLGIDNAVNNIFRWGKSRYISLSQYEEFKNYTIHPRDVIITIMGTVGRSAVIPDDIGLAINTKHLAALTLDEENCNPYYLSYTIHSNMQIMQQIKARSRGSVMDGLNLSLIKKLKIKAAPINLQRQFEIRYKHIQRLKAKILDFVQQLDDLLNSLSQRAFSGQSIVDINVEVEALINKIDIKLIDKLNDIETIKSDSTYLQNLLYKLYDRDFEDKGQYDKAKYIVFRILRESPLLLKQKFDLKNNSIKLEL